MKIWYIPAFILCLGITLTSCGADDAARPSSIDRNVGDTLIGTNGVTNEADKKLRYQADRELSEDFQFDWSKITIEVSYPGREVSTIKGLLIATGWAPSRLASIGPPISINDASKSELIEAALEEYSTLDQAITKNPKSLIINAGLVSDNSRNQSMKNEGLFYINGVLVSAFSDAISGLICITEKQRQFAIYRTRNFSNASRIGDRCRSAIQAFPVLINSGKVAIRPTEISKVKPKARVIAAVTPKRGTFFLVMNEPVNLLPIAELLAKGGSPNVRLVSASKLEVTDEYIGKATAAINFPSGDSAIAAAEGRYLSEGDTRSVRAALILDPTPHFP